MFKFALFVLVLLAIVFITSPQVNTELSHLLDGANLIDILHAIGTSFK